MHCGDDINAGIGGFFCWWTGRMVVKSGLVRDGIIDIPCMREVNRVGLDVR